MRAFLFVLAALHTVAAFAQEARRPFGSPGISGQVVDAQTGAPIEGAVLVARWNWLRYYAGGYHSSPRFSDEGEVLHIAEGVTGDDGRYVVKGWGPIVRGMGKVEEDSPSLSIFKSGYEPFQKNVGRDGSGTIPLRRHSGTPAELAAKIADLQRGRLQPGQSHALHWTYPVDTWKAMPRTILALHREKRLLGEAGDAILGAHLLHGRSGKGTLGLPDYDKKVFGGKGIPATPAIAAITWQIRSDDGREIRRIVQQKRVSGSAATSEFWISPWRHPQPAPAGWSADVEAQPLVRFYAAGYRGSADERWSEAGGAAALEKLPETREAHLGELRRWRRDIDAELAKGERAEALAGQAPLIWVLNEECKQLTLDAREGICFDPAAEIGRLTARPDALEWYMVENELGAHDVRKRKPDPSAPRGTIEGRTVTRERAPDHKPVGGFTIGPAREAKKDAPK